MSFGIQLFNFLGSFIQRINIDDVAKIKLAMVRFIGNSGQLFLVTIFGILLAFANDCIHLNLVRLLEKKFSLAMNSE